MTETATLLNEPAWHGKVFLDGWKPAGGGTSDVVAKATGEVLSSIGLATAEDVATASVSARAAQPVWHAMPYEDRAAIFRRALAGMGEA